MILDLLFIFFDGEIVSEEDIEILLILDIKDWASYWHDTFFWYILIEIYYLGILYSIIEAGSMIEVLIYIDREMRLLDDDIYCRVGGSFLIDTESRIRVEIAFSLWVWKSIEKLHEEFANKLIQALILTNSWCFSTGIILAFYTTTYKGS
jgi:hypothetical protein